MFCLNLKSVGPSHNLGANIQNVISLLKLHNPKICASQHGVNSSEIMSQVQKCRSRSANSKAVNLTYDKVYVSNETYLNKSDSETAALESPSSDSTTTTSQIDFNELLCILQEEYTKLVL